MKKKQKQQQQQENKKLSVQADRIRDLVVDKTVVGGVADRAGTSCLC